VGWGERIRTSDHRVPDTGALLGCARSRRGGSLASVAAAARVSFPAARPVVPLPMNGSKTTPVSGTAAALIACRGKSSGKVEQCGVWLGVCTSFQTDPTGGLVWKA